MTHRLMLLATLAVCALTSTGASAANFSTAAGLARAPLSDLQTVDTRAYQHCHRCAGPRGTSEIRCHSTKRLVCPWPRQPQRPGQMGQTPDTPSRSRG